MNLKSVLYISSLFLVFQSCKSTKLRNQTTFHKYQSVLDSIYAANPNTIGIMAHIESTKHKISWSGSVGLSDKNKRISLESDQPALIASSIKTYVSATILRLQELEKLTIEDAVKKYLSKETTQLFEQDGYNLEEIKIKHLLSHTSGIVNYGTADYLDWVDKHQQHRWTRDEQLELTIKAGNPLGKAGNIFQYTDANYLLTTEIIEQVTDKPFYEAMRDLLKYNELSLSNTWFPTLENKPVGTKSLVHQYWGDKNWDSYEHDISWDLYGGGGIATTTKELAQFSYNLFNGNIIENDEILNLIFTKINTQDGRDNRYLLGLSKGNIEGHTTYGHGGFWGTTVLYFPELDISIAVYVLERNERILRRNILRSLIRSHTKTQ